MMIESICKIIRQEQKENAYRFFIINQDYYQMSYNLSEEEIQAIMDELANIPVGSGNPFHYFGEKPEAIPKPKDSPKEAQKCMFHKWKQYVGITQAYEYCEVCGVERK